MIMDRIALILAIIGGLNWGCVGLFRFDLVAYLFGGQTATVSRVIYTIVGLAAIWCISLLFRESLASDKDYKNAARPSGCAASDCSQTKRSAPEKAWGIGKGDGNPPSRSIM